MKQAAHVVLWILVSFGILQPRFGFAQTVVEGVTYKLDKGTYAPLAGVGVVAVRDSVGPTGAHPVQSDSNGHFRLSVPLGDPILILFYGDARVPQLQQLAGNRTDNLVHVTLYTPKEYQERHPKGPSLETKYRCLTEEVPKDSEAAMILRHSIDKLDKY
jgi:hypothetical protein